ncbi:MAG: Holliday junction branch migration protein RuvA [Marinifilaceae bacterium]|jgi:Holliday junction DNA helicase RuvA|nr:Holliday junction branch migration protein RuvA [Marinifilaceae bacterium]
MFEFIKGKIDSITPTFVIVENNGIGYHISISLHTYSQINELEQVKLFIHQVIREDANLLFGFSESSEREIFRFLISVSGVGANTGRMMLSSMSPDEIKTCILTDNSKALTSIKGIGAKTAQRIIIELKDKIGKDNPDVEISVSQNNNVKEEALSALVMLGFAKNTVIKALNKLHGANPNIQVEELIKLALKQL